MVIMLLCVKDVKVKRLSKEERRREGTIIVNGRRIF
jgi:hypothetical protein